MAQRSRLQPPFSSAGPQRGNTLTDAIITFRELSLSVSQNNIHFSMCHSSLTKNNVAHMHQYIFSFYLIVLIKNIVTGQFLDAQIANNQTLWVGGGKPCQGWDLASQPTKFTFLVMNFSVFSLWLWGCGSVINQWSHINLLVFLLAV